MQNALRPSYDNTIRIWDITTGECLHVLKDHTRLIHHLRVDPSGKFLCSISSNGEFKRWDPDNSDLLHTSKLGDAFCDTNDIAFAAGAPYFVRRTFASITSSSHLFTIHRLEDAKPVAKTEIGGPFSHPAGSPAR